MRIESDLVIVNGNIHTMDPTKPHATALAVKSYKIIAVGSDEDVLDLVPHAKKVIDMGGKTIIPGFVDGHTHLTSTGVRYFQVHLHDVSSLEEAITALKSGAEQKEVGEWVIGWGYDESKWKNRRYLTAKDLDTVSKKHPVCAIRVDGHLMSLNTLGLDKIGIDLNQEGVDKDKKGNPTGILRDIDDMYKGIRASPEETYEGAIMGTRIAASLGITTAIDNIAHGQLRQIREAEHKNLLNARIVVNIPDDLLSNLVKIGITSGMGTPLSRIGGLKIFTDGSIGAKTAAVNEPYLCEKDNKGRLLYEKKKFQRVIKKAIGAGIQTVTHAIGDRAIEMILTAFEELSDEEKAIVRTQRHRIEHAEMISEVQIRRAAALGIILSMQPNFVGEWQLEGGMYDERFGPERVKYLNNFRVVLDNGARLCFGSDGMPLGPLYGIWCATTHLNPKVQLTVEEALRCYTLESAYASFLEHTVGSIMEGKRADFVVLSKDILRTPPNMIKDIQIERTFLGGEAVYESHA